MDRAKETSVPPRPYQRQPSSSRLDVKPHLTRFETNDATFEPSLEKQAKESSSSQQFTRNFEVRNQYEIPDSRKTNFQETKTYSRQALDKRADLFDSNKAQNLPTNGQPLAKAQFENSPAATFEHRSLTRIDSRSQLLSSRDPQIFPRAQEPVTEQVPQSNFSRDSQSSVRTHEDTKSRPPQSVASRDAQFSIKSHDNNTTGGAPQGVSSRDSQSSNLPSTRTQELEFDRSQHPNTLHEQQIASSVREFATERSQTTIPSREIPVNTRVQENDRPLLGNTPGPILSRPPAELIRRESSQKLEAPSAGNRLFRQFVHQQVIPGHVSAQGANLMGLSQSKQGADHLVKLARTEMSDASRLIDNANPTRMDNTPRSTAADNSLRQMDPRPLEHAVRPTDNNTLRQNESRSVENKPRQNESRQTENTARQPEARILESTTRQQPEGTSRQMENRLIDKPARHFENMSNRQPDVRQMENKPYQNENSLRQSNTRPIESVGMQNFETDGNTEIRSEAVLRRFDTTDRPLLSEQPDSLTSIKSGIMPSGKPVAKEMTITVTGKLPPQQQVRAAPRRQETGRYSEQQQMESNDKQFTRNDSSGNLIYRQQNEESRSKHSEILTNNKSWRDESKVEDVKRITDAESLPVYDSFDENASLQRPSDLNLSGSVSDKKSRVGWKGSEEVKKASGRMTPGDKGVSFVETPRKKISDTKVPGTWCALTGRFIPLSFERPKSPDPRPKTPTTPRKKRFVGSYCPKTGRYIPPEGESGASTPDIRARTPREDLHVSFTEYDAPSPRCWTPRTPKKPNIAFGSVVPPDPPSNRRRVRRTKSNDWVERRYRSADGDHDSGVDDATQETATANGEVKTGASQPRRSPAPTKLPGHKRASTPGSPASSPLKSPGKPHAPRSASLTPEPNAERKKLPMNKIQVGNAASPNLKQVRSKIGSLENATHKPGGGQVKIENRKVEFNKVTSRIAAKNDMYQPGGGDKKIPSQKLQWNAKSKIGSLENATHKAGGGEKKIESQKLDFKDKAKPKIGSKDNLKHQPGGGNIKIENQKLDFKVTSKVGSLANVTHKPGGGDVKIFDDKEYLRQMSGEQSTGTHSTGTHSKASSEGQPSGTQSPVPTSQHPAAGPMSPTRS